MPSDAPPPEPPPPPKKKSKPRKPKIGKTWFPTITKNRIFAGLLIFVAIFTPSAFAVRVALAFAAKEPPTQMQVELAHICDYIIMAGFSSLIGLLAGRAAVPDQSETGKNE